ADHHADACPTVIVAAVQCFKSATPLTPGQTTSVIAEPRDASRVIRRVTLRPIRAIHRVEPQPSIANMDLQPVAVVFQLMRAQQGPDGGLLPTTRRRVITRAGKRILCPTARVTQMLKHTHVGPARSVFEKSFLARRCRSPALKIADKASPRPCRFLPRRPLISNSLWINSAIDSCLPSLTIGARLIW